MDNKEQCRKLANRIYELDEKVYKTSGSGLGKTFTGEKARVLDNLTVLIVSNPQGHLLRSELALIGNMARSIRDKDARHDLLIEYNDILEEIANLPMSFGSVDIVDKDLADMNSSILNKNFRRRIIWSSVSAVHTEVQVPISDLLWLRHCTSITMMSLC